MLFVFNPRRLMHAEPELNARHKHVLVVDILDERVIPSVSTESREAEWGGLSTYAAGASIGSSSTGISTDVVDHLVEGQPEVIAVVKVLPNVQISPREMEAAGEHLVVVRRRVADTFRGVPCKGSSRGIGRVQIDDHADLDALERGEAL